MHTIFTSTKTNSRWVVASILYMAAVLLPTPPSQAQMYKGTQLVKAELLADTSAIAPGKPFTVGLRLRMAPHWHTYWQNSGDAGLPTKLDWQLPDGFKAGPIQWPVPTRIDSPGDIVNYGYSDLVILLTQITPPAQLPPGEASIKAKATWLVCADLCVPGDASLALNLPVNAGGEAVAAANAPAFAFAETRALLPKGGGVGADTRPLFSERKLDGGNLLLDFTVAAPPAGKYGAEFFPLPPDDVEVGHPATTAVGTMADGRVTVSVKLPITTNSAGANRVAGVLVLTSPDGDRLGYAVDPQVSASAHEPVSASATTTGSGVALGHVGGQPGSADSTGSLWHFLLYGLVGGLILNVMPCVLPVISLKVFSFIKQADQVPERVFKLGLAYIAGVFAWFLGFAALVVALKAGGREVGYAFHLQNPWFIVALSAAVFVFALNLLGVFEFILPGVVVGALGKTAQRDEGYSGAFAQGVLATILGSACTAPFFGAALGFAFAQSAPVIFAMFTAIALGMSLPFLLLTAFPRWLRFLPRPGAWMERVKQATGFLMLATLLWLLSILGAMRGADAVVWTGVLLLFLAVACWIQGSFNTPIASPRSRGIALSAMLALVLVGGWFSVGRIAAAQLGEAVDDHFPERLEAALQEPGRLVFVDFTAAWCVNCKANERLVINTEPVRRAFKEANANVLTADWTNGQPGITALLKKFGSAGVPLYVLYPADRARAPIVLPELLTQETVLEALKSATASKRVATAVDKSLPVE